MGLFVLCTKTKPTPEDLINSAKANIELYLKEGGDYLLEAFALPYLNEALEKLKDDK